MAGSGRGMSKRLFDLTLSVATLIALSPIFFVVALGVRIFLGQPILFRQVRPGKAGEPFEMLKFRSMKDGVDKHGELLPDAERLTRFGQFLRTTSLDELPGLWNVIKGDMSLVGPRPLLLEYLPLYSAEQSRRHEVKPGITGWAQVNGRNALNWEEKFSLDVWYVDNQSLWLDVRILFLTVKKVAAREGVSGNGEVTMSKFTGSQLLRSNTVDAKRAPNDVQRN